MTISKLEIISLTANYQVCLSSGLLPVLPLSLQIQVALEAHKKSTSQKNKIAGLLPCILKAWCFPRYFYCLLPSSQSMLPNYLSPFISTVLPYIADRRGQKSLICIICFPGNWLAKELLCLMHKYYSKLKNVILAGDISYFFFYFYPPCILVYICCHFSLLPGQIVYSIYYSRYFHF